VVERGITPREYPLARLDVVSGAVFADAIAFFIIVATGATLFVHGIAVTTAADAAKALEPFAGPFATTLFAVGLLGASLLAAAVLPLTSAYSVAEAFGFEKGVTASFRGAPVFMGIFTSILTVGAAVALVPGLPAIQMLLIIQVVNGMLLPVVLIAALKLTNNAELMGPYKNGGVFNGIAIVTTLFVIALSTFLLVITLLQPLGVSLGG
jgi:Mn2+/Fe2+ NRAMP family transporter